MLFDNGLARNRKVKCDKCQWLTPVILDTLEAEIRRIEV
jgi:hypothetical protein